MMMMRRRMRTIGRFDDDDDDDDDVETRAKCPSRLRGILFLPTGIFATGNVPRIRKIQSRNCEQCSKSIICSENTLFLLSGEQKMPKVLHMLNFELKILNLRIFLRKIGIVLEKSGAKCLERRTGCQFLGVRQRSVV